MYGDTILMLIMMIIIIVFAIFSIRNLFLADDYNFFLTHLAI